MKATDRAVVSGLFLVGLLAAFYFLVLAPKRQEASKLGEDIAALESQISQQEQTVAFAEEARKEFPKYYGRMVVLGKAAPEQADTASMLVQVNSISERAGVRFRSLALAEGGGESAGQTAGAASTPAPATPAPATPAPAEGTAPAEGAPADAAQPSTDATSTATTAAGSTAPAPATESAAANLPIGASVGPAGLPTLPYSYVFDGTFFDVADFMAGVDGLVQAGDDGTQVDVNGRLMTIDGFSLLGGSPGSDPDLEALFAVTTYTVPSEQGLTLGASPTAPGVPAAPQTTPASTVSAP